MPYFIWIFFIILTACSHSPEPSGKAPQDLKPHWIKNTYKESIHSDTKAPHLMQPLVVQNFIFQGNGRDGLVAYDKNTGRDLWRKDIEGGVQGATLNNNHLYIAGGDGFIYSLNATTGETVWSYNLKIEVLHSPTFYKGALYILTSNNTVYALTAETGELKWTYIRRGTSLPLNIYGNSLPLIYKNNILLGLSDGFLVCISQDTGALVWEKSLSRFGRFKNLYVTLNENTVYVSSYEQDIYALDARSGRIFWTIEKMGGSSPVTVHQNDVFFSTFNGDIASANKATGKLRWKHSLKNSIATRPIISQNTVYVAQSNGPLLALNKATGKVEAQYDRIKGALAPIHFQDNRIYLMSNEGQLHVINIRH